MIRKFTLVILVLIFSFNYAYSASTPDAFDYCRKFKFPTNTVTITGNLTQFPHLIDINSSSWSNATERGHFFGDYNNVSGHEGKRIQIFDKDFNNLAYEVDTYSHASQIAKYWVSGSTLVTYASDDGASNYVWVCYGNDPNSSDQNNNNGVWDSNYKMVHHMNDTTTSSITDSTSNGNNGTKKGAGEPAVTTSGYVGNAQDFDGSNDYVTLDGLVTSLAANTTGTISFWGNIDTDDGNQNLPFSISRDANATRTEVWIDFDMRAGQDCYQSMLAIDGTYQWALETPADSLDSYVGAWLYTTLVQDGTAPIVYFGSTSQTLTWNTTTNKTKWTKAILADATSDADTANLGDIEVGGSDYVHFDGKVDEIRISATNRSADWVKLEYNSMLLGSSWHGGGWYSWDSETDLKLYEITVTDGSNGSISPNTGVYTYYSGQQKVFTVTPDANYFAVMSGTCGGTLVSTTYTTNAITGDCTVIASFDRRVITVTEGDNGSISPNGTVYVAPNTTKEFTVTPDCVYEASMSGTCGGTLVGTTYTTNSISADCTVIANFNAKYTYYRDIPITGSTGAGTNYPVRLQVSNWEGTQSAGVVYLNNKSQSDLKDIQFTDTSNNCLDFWFEGKLVEIEPHESNPILSPSGSETDVFLSSVWKEGDTYYGYYDAMVSSVWQVSLATSSDGITWTKDTEHSPLMTGEGRGAFNAQVWKEGSTYYMLYSYGAAPDIGLATASYPYGPWSASGSNPVINASAAWEEGDAEQAFGTYKIGSTYYNWYNDMDAAITGSREVGLATSTNLTSWTKDSNNPIFGPGNFIPTVLYFEGYYYMFIAQRNFSGHSSSRIDIYKDDSPTFYDDEREFVGTIHQPSYSGWDQKDSDAPLFITDDIFRNAFYLSENKLYLYLGATGSDDHYSQGLFIEDDMYNGLNMNQGYFWVEVASDLGSDQTIRIWYGGDESALNSNGANTFPIFYDHTTMASGWTTTNMTITDFRNTYAYFLGTTSANSSAERSVSLTPTKYCIEARLANMDETTANDEPRIMLYDGSYSHIFFLALLPSAANQSKWYYYDSVGGYTQVGDYLEEHEYNFQARIDEGDSSTGITLRLYDKSKATLLSSVSDKAFAVGSPTDADMISIDNRRAASLTIKQYFRWLFFRPCIDSEPTVGTAGSQVPADAPKSHGWIN